MRRRWPRGGSWLAGLLVAFAAPSAERATLQVSCAVSLKPALAEIVEVQRRDQPESRVQFNAGGSSLLAQQILRGAPVDLFVSAAPAELDRLERAGRVRSGSRRPIAGNGLVLVAPSGAPLPESLPQLAEPRFDRIAVGNPKTAPLGRYTQQALARHGLEDLLRDRLVFGENARQVGEYVARGEVSAGVLYSTDARLLGRRISVGAEIPAEVHEPIVYEAAVIDDTEVTEAALALLDRLTSAEARAILARHGFTTAR